MKIIRSHYEILNERELLTASKSIEVAARTCYKSEDKISEDSDVSLMNKLISCGHEAMLEFGPSISVVFVCDRGISHELVRHRLCSFAQESTRYCNYSKDKFDNQITFILPMWLYDKYGTPEYGVWAEAMEISEMKYNSLINDYGWQPQQARAVLPNSLKTEIVVKANIREWRHIFRLRTSPKAHPQMRELMIPLLKHFQEFCPLLFNDIVF